MNNIVEDLIDFILDTWKNWRDKDKKLYIKSFSIIACILIDFYYAILEIVDTWKAKDEKIIIKIFCSILTIIFFIVGIRIWLTI